MKCFLTTMLDHVDLVPYFVAHYGKLGATCFPVLTYGTQACHDKVREYIESQGYATESVGVYPVDKFHARPNMGHITDTREGIIAKYVGDVREWTLYPDMDEFVECTREQLESAMKHSRHGYIAGAWLDRVAEGGKLKNIEPGVPLEEQFPLGGQVRRLMGIRGTPPCYIASMFPPSCHHPTSCSNGGMRGWKRGVRPHFRVHHFKWQENAWERMRERKRIIVKLLKNKPRKPRLGTVMITLRHFNRYKGINPKQLRYIGNRLGI